eukprot:TRINITY_DN1278_c0_g1_i1.p1 TRINITY_DN1278_c0_g1~~TRINITY_DN1278_c0_g1_i1.p1  ORF type:complete len:271 (-),score=42.72 TRINITY_DN1278_c0_g1_i1:82-894(-)
MQDIECALDLMRRLPPSQIEDNLAGVIDIVPDLTEELLSSVDQPLKIVHDSESKRDYLICDYNRDGDSFRSPWSNKFDPPLHDGQTPSGELRDLEIKLNEAFDIYRDLYYEGGVSSVYCWNLEGNNFAACILIKKTQDHSKQGQPMKGTWDSVHVLEVEIPKKGTARYKLTSTVMLTIDTNEPGTTGSVSLAGSLNRQEEKSAPIDQPNSHVVNIGSLVEAMEIKLRQTLETIYFGKTKDISNELRQAVPVSVLKQRHDMTKQLTSQLKT